MPGDYFRETVIMVDYDSGVIRIDTTKESDASKARRKGFTEITQKNSRPYRRFTGNIKSFSVNFGKKRAGKVGGNPEALSIARKNRKNFNSQP